MDSFCYFFFLAFVGFRVCSLEWFPNSFKYFLLCLELEIMNVVLFPQIVSPVDKGISKCISENLEPWSTSWDAGYTETCPLRVDPFDDILAKYLQDVTKLCYFK